MAKKTKYSDVVREGDFLDYGAVKADAKHRVVLKGPVHELYRVYRNEAGQILLDPQVMIPANEAWLFKNKKALASVRRGLQQMAEGKGRCLGSHAKYADIKLDD
ncbi:MAG: hypothetical protein PHU21_02295 [Elusimicrobia bacterium]|nr:hypothetical protein [Elusimicrobiota bacterium]